MLVAVTGQERAEFDIGPPRTADLFRELENYAARSTCGKLRPIESGVTLVISRLLLNRIRGLFASLRRADRNASMNKTATPQTPMKNAISPVTII
jgi:hypothetical protein